MFNSFKFRNLFDNRESKINRNHLMQINKSVYLLLLDKYIYFFLYQRYNLLHLPQLSLLKYTTIFLCVCRNCRNQFLIFILLDVSQLFRFLNTCYDKFLSDRLIYHDHHPHHLHLYHYHHWEISEKKKEMLEIESHVLATNIIFLTHNYWEWQFLICILLLLTQLFSIYWNRKNICC